MNPIESVKLPSVNYLLTNPRRELKMAISQLLLFRRFRSISKNINAGYDV